MSNAANHDNIIRSIETRLSFSAETQPTEAAVLVAITNEAQPKILLTRRASHMRSHAGEIAFPGGRRESIDRSSICVALREAHEEINLASDQVKLLGDLPTEHARAGIEVKPIVGLIPHNLEFTPQPSEIERIFCAPIDIFLTQQPQPYSFKMGNQQLYFPSFRYEGEVVWGLTARIIVSLLNQSLEKKIEWPFLWPGTEIKKE